MKNENDDRMNDEEYMKETLEALSPEEKKLLKRIYDTGNPEMKFVPETEAEAAAFVSLVKKGILVQKTPGESVGTNLLKRNGFSF
jgi:hypothetical protein